MKMMEIKKERIGEEKRSVNVGPSLLTQHATSYQNYKLTHMHVFVDKS